MDNKKVTKLLEGQDDAGPGRCAHCGSEDIDYRAQELEGEDAYYPYDCQDCGKSGKEWYHMQYIENEPDKG